MKLGILFCMLIALFSLFYCQDTLNELKQKLWNELQNDVEANNKIYEDTIANEAPGCLRSFQMTCKNNEVTSQQEFDRAVDEKVTGIQKELEKKLKSEIEERVSKIKDEWMSELSEKIQQQFPNFETPNRLVSLLSINYYFCLF